MNEEKNLSFTINENDISKNTFEIKIIVDDNRILNKREILTYNINRQFDLFSYEDKMCLLKFFFGIGFLITFILILESVRK